MFELKCSYCHKNVKNISHFMKAHKKIMLKKMRAGKHKAPRRIKGVTKSNVGISLIKKGLKLLTGMG